MDEVKSSADDCYRLGGSLHEKLGRKLCFYGSLYQPLISGRYYVSNQDINNNDGGVDFSLEFSNDKLIRIGIGRCSYNKNASRGEQLAALSDFFDIFYEDYGYPTYFYTKKDDDNGYIYLQWSFKNRDNDIEEIKKDPSIDTLIIMNEKNINPGLTKRMELPSELVNIVDANIEDYLRYKDNVEYNIEPVKKLVKKSK